MTRSVAAVILGGVLASCSSCGAGPEERGRADAESEIAGGEPRVLFLGGPGLHESWLDPSTGLFRRAYGCVEDADTKAYVKAHNDRLVAALAEGRLDGMHFRDRILTREQVAARFAKEGGSVLAKGGPPADSPDGTFRVTADCAFPDGMGRRPGEKKPGDESVPVSLMVLVRARGDGGPVEGFQVLDAGTRVLFEHGGRTLLIHDPGRREFLTLDMEKRQWLQCFPDR